LSLLATGFTVTKADRVAQRRSEKLMMELRRHRIQAKELLVPSPVSRRKGLDAVGKLTLKEGRR
jgi:hypothetical protein